VSLSTTSQSKKLDLSIHSSICSALFRYQPAIQMHQLTEAFKIIDASKLFECVDQKEDIQALFVQLFLSLDLTKVLHWIEEFQYDPQNKICLIELIVKCVDFSILCRQEILADENIYDQIQAMGKMVDFKQPPSGKQSQDLNQIDYSKSKYEIAISVCRPIFQNLRLINESFRIVLEAFENLIQKWKI
jgi:hypothetical protein